MNLREYFTMHPEVTKRQFAELCETGVETVFAWQRGRTPTLDMALRIERATNGKVRPKDLLAVKKRKKK